MGARHVDLGELTERIRAIERRCDAAAAHRFIDEPAEDRVPTGWPDIDAALGGGLPAGGLHEWFGVEESPGRDADETPKRSPAQRWTPPLCVLAHLAWRAFDRLSSPPWTVWIGKRCHPYPRVLVRGDDRRLLERSLFVAPGDAASRLWAVDLALRSPAVGCVVADGSDFDRAATQRVQRLARSQAKIALATRPPRQQRQLSAAQTRWRICAAPPLLRQSAKGVQPRWSVELLRCKGMRPTQDHCAWLLEWHRGEGVIHLSARLAGPAGPAGRPEEQVPHAEPRRFRRRRA